MLYLLYIYIHILLLLSLIIFQYFVKYFIIIFPLPALISSYPVNAITLGNNLVASTPQSIIDKYGYRKLQMIFLSLSVIVPIGLSALVSQVPIILDISGTMGYFIMFITPGIVQVNLYIYIYILL